ncbi:TlpA family protein disulfide reductase [Deminuibacter soli]|nr:TlpA disulfide reductase family protein [Deminuibacter soli]
MKTILAFLLALTLGTSAMAQGGNKQMPEIQLPDANGNTVKLSSLKGKVVLVDFWASWCGPCRQSMPHLKKLYSEYKSKGFEIYGISLDESAAPWKRAVKEDGTSWIHVLDTQGRTAQQFNVQYIPTSYLIDKEGKVVAVNADKDQLEKLVKQLL